MFKKILSKIKPEENEVKEISERVKKFLKILNPKLKNASAFIGGSFAKNTWLKGNHDIDVFVVFENNKKMSERLEYSIKKSFKKYRKLHGSRDYFIVDFEGLGFELVPVFKIKKPEEAENITDISLMHVKFVKEKTNEKLCDEIRLAKYFLKMNKCYGAETYIGGFSGYLVELLVVYYKSFQNFIKNAAKWKYSEIISFGRNNFVSGQKFPLIVIDPVQPNRNAAAALRKEKFSEFAALCKKFLQKQNISYFKEKKINLKKYDLVFEVYPLEGNEDVVGTKMLKAFEFIKREFIDNGFAVKNSGWFWDKNAYLCFKFKNKKIKKYREHFGPYITMSESAASFRLKHKNRKIIIRNKRLVAYMPRRFTKVSDLAKSIIRDKNVRSRVKKIKLEIKNPPKAI